MTADELEMIFTTALSEEPSLKSGNNRREAVRAFVEGREHENPYPYRLNFIRDAALAAIKTMGTESEAFNARYPSDMATAGDLIDITLTALNLIVKQAGFVGVNIKDGVITIVRK